MIDQIIEYNKTFVAPKGYEKYADKTVVMVNEQVKDYYAAIDRYLTEQIAGLQRI